MTKLTLTEQEELFAKDCKLINLRYEYTNYTGKEKWAVITELTEKELRKKYPDKMTLDVYGYEDDISEQFHRELITPFADPFEQAEEERFEIEKEQLRRMEIEKVRKVLAMMKPIQKERLCKVVLLGLSSRKIAQEEGINYNAVDKSIKAAKKNFKKYYENL